MDQNSQATDIQINLRILVADDYEVNQKITQLILQKEGYDVDIVADGQQAVEAHRQNQYDLILMDIKMPIMDGLEATRQIRKAESAFATANADVSKTIAIGQVTDDRGQRTEVRNQNTGNPSSPDGFAVASRGQRKEVEKLRRREGEKKSEIPNPKSQIKSVPIIAMTGDAADGAFDEQQYPGMNDCLGKPLQREHLLSIVQKWGNGASNSRTVENPQEEVLCRSESSMRLNAR